MKGENASSSTVTGSDPSWKSICASGYSPTKVADSIRLSPGTLSEPNPSWPWYGLTRRDSSTRATGFSVPACAQIEGKANLGLKPLFGRLKISQSRSCPHPPKLMLPAATPPRGKAIIASLRPSKRRGKPGSTRFSACSSPPGELGATAAEDQYGACAATPRAPAACFKKPLRFTLNGSFIILPFAD